MHSEPISADQPPPLKDGSLSALAFSDLAGFVIIVGKEAVLT